MGCRVIENGEKSAAENMRQDGAFLLNLAQENSVILHLYDWESDAATFGHFTDVAKFLNKAGIDKHGLDCAKRPTGGGIVFHNCDLAFSVLVPSRHPAFSLNTLRNYAFVNEKVKNVIRMFREQQGRPAAQVELLQGQPCATDSESTHFCMAHPTKYDVMLDGRKVGGAAQRRTKYGFLHQGSIFIGHLEESYLRDIIQPHVTIVQGMHANSAPLLEGQWTTSDLNEARNNLKTLLKLEFSEDNYV